MRRSAVRALALGLFLTSVSLTAYSFVSLLMPGTALIPNRPSPIDFLTFALTFIAFPSVGAVVAWKRPTNPIGWLFLVIGLGVTVSVAAGEYADRYLYVGSDLPAVAIVAWVGTWSWIVTMGLALTVAVQLFPTGRLPSPRWRPLVWLSAITIGATAMAEALRPGPMADYEGSGLERPLAFGGAVGELMQAVADIGMALVVALGAVSIASLVIRFRNADHTERQQLKWFLYPAALLLVGLVGASLLQTPLAWSVALLGLAAIPVSAGIAILRHRLFDIDLVINRTLVYATLTVLLAAVYVGLILLLQGVVSPLVGTESVAVALSTLAVAALFGPLRRRVQNVVDRRFYRSRYDAQHTLAGFAAGLRNEVDLDSLTVELQRAAQQALRPATTSVWLRGPER